MGVVTRKSSNTENHPPRNALITAQMLRKFTPTALVRDATKRRRVRLLTSFRPGHPGYIPNLERAARAEDLRIRNEARIDFNAPVRGVSLGHGFNVDVSVRNISLPSRLGRPQFVEVDREVIALIDSRLEGTPVQFIRDSLETVGSRMAQVLKSITVDLSGVKEVPREITVVVNDISAEVPTHMLAVYDQICCEDKRHVTLYPIHNIVLAVNAPRLPPLSDSHPTPPSAVGGSVTLPVTSFGVPDSETFPFVTGFLYTKNHTALLNHILPQAPPPVETLASRGDAMRAYAHELAQTFTMHALMRSAMRINGVWRNACALGIPDHRLWNAVDVAWDCILHAIAISVGKPGAVEEAERDAFLRQMAQDRERELGLQLQQAYQQEIQQQQLLQQQKEQEEQEELKRRQLERRQERELEREQERQLELQLEEMERERQRRQQQ